MGHILIRQYLNRLRDLRKVSDQRIAWQVPKQDEAPSKSIPGYCVSMHK